MNHALIYIMATFLFANALMAGPQGFDQSPIDYFGDPQKEASPEQSFDWSATLDVESDEFFREGNYLPPAAFMELARRPTEQNIRNWIAYQNKKQKLTDTLNEKVSNYKKARRERNKLRIVVSAQANMLIKNEYVDFSKKFSESGISVEAICTSNCRQSKFKKASKALQQQMLPGQYLVSVLLPGSAQAAHMHAKRLDHQVYAFIQTSLSQNQTKKGDQR